jgi:Mce-associated membrane protein
MAERLDERTDETTAPAADEATAPAADAAPEPAAKRRPTKAERLEAKAARLREAEQRRTAAGADSSAAAPRGLVIALAALAAVAVAATALLVITFLAWRHQRDVDRARAAAVTAARAFAIDFGSYDYRNLDADFHGVAERMTPGFASSYLDSSTRLEPTFRQYRTQVTAHIQGVGVTSASTSRATILVFLDQTVRTSQSGTPRLDRNRLEVQLVHRGGRWLVQRLFAR